MCVCLYHTFTYKTYLVWWCLGLMFVIWSRLESEDLNFIHIALSAAASPGAPALEMLRGLLAQTVAWPNISDILWHSLTKHHQISMSSKKNRWRHLTLWIFLEARPFLTLTIRGVLQPLPIESFRACCCKETIAFSDPVDRVLYQDLLMLGLQPAATYRALMIIWLWNDMIDVCSPGLERVFISGC